MSNRTLVGKRVLGRGSYHLDLRVLGQYLVVCETLSMSAAARKLGISTPAASQLVHRLEHDLDVHLFERTAGGLRLTPAGLLLREKARQLIENEADALHELRTYRGRLVPKLRLYMMDSVAIHLVNALLPDLTSAVTRLEVLSGRSLTHTRDFLTGEIDLLIASDGFDDIPMLESHRLCRQGLVAVLPSSIPESQRTPEALVNRLPLIRFREGSVIDNDVTKYLLSCLWSRRARSNADRRRPCCRSSQAAMAGLLRRRSWCPGSSSGSTDLSGAPSPSRPCITTSC